MLCKIIQCTICNKTIAICAMDVTQRFNVLYKRGKILNVFLMFLCAFSRLFYYCYPDIGHKIRNLDPLGGGHLVRELRESHRFPYYLARKYEYGRYVVFPLIKRSFLQQTPLQITFAILKLS